MGHLCLVAIYACYSVFAANFGQVAGAEKPSRARPLVESAFSSRPVSHPDKSGWSVREEALAIASAQSILGAAAPAVATATSAAAIVELTSDTTPYLGEGIVARPLWQVTIRDWSPQVTEGPTELTCRSFDVDILLDPVNGAMLKLESRWPKDVPPIAPEATSESAERQMTATKERYHAFSEGNPTITFREALAAIRNGGGNPCSAVQFSAVWVRWSEFGKEPSSMWVITLRGIGPVGLHADDVPLDLQNHLRYVVDPVKKKWISATTTPQPDNFDPDKRPSVAETKDDR